MRNDNDFTCYLELASDGKQVYIVEWPYDDDDDKQYQTWM